MSNCHLCISVAVSSHAGGRKLVFADDTVKSSLSDSLKDTVLCHSLLIRITSRCFSSLHTNTLSALEVVATTPKLYILTYTPAFLLNNATQLQMPKMDNLLSGNLFTGS